MSGTFRIGAATMAAMRNPLTPTWRTQIVGGPKGTLMPADLPTVTLRYRNPVTGETAVWVAPAPCPPEIARKIDAAFAARGFVREEES